MIVVGVVAAAVGSFAGAAAWWLSRPLSVFVPTPVAVAIVGLAVAAGGWKTSMPSVAVVGPMLLAIGFMERRRQLQLAETDALDQQLPALVEAMVQQLRSGVGLHSLCRRPPSIADQVDAMAAPMVIALDAGRPLIDAVSQFGSAAGSGQGSRLVATALTMVAEHGGPAVPALRRLSLTLTGAAQARADARAQSSQALASARLLAMAPALFALLLATFDDELADLYLRRPLGAVCLSASILLTYGGWRWMNRIVVRVSSEANPDWMAE